jgi:ABC-type nitrate/sulfonate/bicarbonate transport system ATPase subunit
MTPSSNRILEVNEVDKIWQGRAGAIVALQNVSFTVAPSEFVCLLGPSGCGKSTLLEIVAGLLQPSSGHVLMDGKEVREASPERGMVFQAHALFPWRTARENVEFGLEMRRVDRAERRRIARQLLALVGLNSFEDALPRELSGGMCQRVAVARALANSPKLLLMDEPFGALDAQTREELQREVVRIWEETRTTVIFVTHSVQEAVILADRIVVMTRRPGRIQTQIPNRLARPRDVTSPEFGTMMRQVYQALEAARVA